MRIVIIVVCVIAITATIGAIIVGLHSFEGLVVEKPYEKGLMWDESRREQARLGWTVSLRGTPFKTGDNDLSVSVLDKNGSLISDAVTTVMISRPSTRAYDKDYRTVRQADGRYHASIDLPLYGNWDIIIDVSRDNEHETFKKAVYAAQGVK